RQRRTFVGLQFRFTVLMLSLALAAIALVGGVLVNLTSQLASRHKQQQCVQLASLLAKSAAEPLQRKDADSLQSLAERFGVEGGALFVAVANPLGEVVAASDSLGRWVRIQPEAATLNGEETLGVPVFMQALAGWEAHLQVTYPVNGTEPDDSGARPLLGYARVGLEVQNTMRDLTATIDLFTGMSVALLILAFPLAYLVVQRVVFPVNELSRVVRQFASGDLAARSAVRRNDEIGELAGAFNTMADELTRKHDEILALNADLEERVQRRTRQLRELASREPLTGLYNRRHFNEVLSARFSEALRYGSDLSCVMLDLDDFKSVNDRFGHHIGDELLILTSVTVGSQLRAADVAARYGGDEFVILLPQTDADRARVLAERIAEKFAKDLAEKLPQIHTSLSIGIVSFGEAEGGSPDDLLRAADEAMYRAKARGKSRIVMAEVVA
ncbi:MAG TPA: diguanylate cyclase, partial [Phycisphaerae bacterium]|nr:diguanylate cyclase [Phycisphaerae bacterium]